MVFYIVITGYLNEIDTNNILNEMDREIDGFFFIKNNNKKEWEYM
jgi:hypothetical protein